MRKILLLVNPLFDSHRRRYLPGIFNVFRDAGLQFEVLETNPDRATNLLLRDKVANNIDAIFVCGGDGTIFDTLQWLAGSEVPLGIIPFGTGNVLAQNLRIPRNPAQAARWLLNTTPLTVPLGKITCPAANGTDTWFFAMAAGMGGHAEMMRAAARFRKHSAGRLAYFMAGFETLLTYPLQPFQIEITTVSGEVLQRRASEVIAVHVAELNLWRPGGGLQLPFLRLASVETASRPQLLKASLEALVLGAGQRHRQPAQNAAARYEDVLRVACTPLSGHTYGQPIAVEADGEVLGYSSAIIEMAGASIRLLARVGV